MQKKKGKNKQKHKVFPNNRAYEINTIHVRNLSTKNHAFRFTKKNFQKTLAFLNSVLRFKVSNYSLE